MWKYKSNVMQEKTPRPLTVRKATSNAYVDLGNESRTHLASAEWPAGWLIAVSSIKAAAIVHLLMVVVSQYASRPGVRAISGPGRKDGPPRIT